MIDYVPGLAKVPAAESSISFINGEEGILEYRGIRIEELAEHSNFEEVTYLLLDGELPNETELEELTHKISNARSLSPSMKSLIAHFPTDAHPMAALQTCVSAMGMEMERSGVQDESVRRHHAIEIIGKMPTMVAACHRARTGKKIVDPDPSLTRSADFLRMINDEIPDELSTKVMDVSLVLHADHTMNASTFAARVTASTESEPAAAIAAAVGSLSGPLHGGANERVLFMLDEVGSIEAVSEWFDGKMERKEKIMGLGHRVYKTKDPRATILQGLKTALFEKHGASPLYEIAVELERIAKERIGHRGIYPNVDFYSGIVYNKLGIPTDLFTPIFAISRVSGWMAHWLEQMKDNRLFRPTQVYTGRREVPYVPMKDRDKTVATS